MKQYNVDFSFDLSDSIIWQYDTAERLLKLFNARNRFYQKATGDFWRDWYQNVFNLETANYFGLIVWALILGCTEYIELTQRLGRKSFGFGSAHRNFFESNFALSSYIYSLNEDQLRKVLKAQMLNFYSNGSLYDINRLLVYIFPEHMPYARYDKTTNEITYYFPIALNNDDLSIVMFSNMLPAPVGVRRKIQNGPEDNA